MALLRATLIRGLILALLGGTAAAGWVVTHRASPEQVRAAFVAAVESQLVDVRVEVGSARLRLFGGVTVTDLRLTRTGDDAPFFQAATAVIYHDKQTLHRGRMDLRKIELDAPTIRLARRPDGTWNTAGLTRPAPDAATLPTVVARGATVFVTGLGDGGGVPPVVVSDVRFTLVNDPAPILTADVHATVAPVRADGGPPGFVLPVGIAVKYHRDTRQAQARVEIADLAITPDVAAAAAVAVPDAAEFAEKLSARIGVKADILAEPGKPVRYDARIDVKDGRFADDRLPWPLEQAAASVRVADGRVTVERGTAKFGPAAVTLGLETRGTPAADAASVGDLLERLELAVRGLPLSDELFGKLPPRALRYQEMFRPRGAVDLTFRFARTGPGWRREVEVRPNGLGIEYERFRYPVEHLAGRFVSTVASDGTDEARIEMTGSASGRRIEATGTISGDGPDPKIRLRLAGTGVPIDDKLFDALEPKHGKALKKLRAAGRGDFVADIRQDFGVNKCENTVRINVYGTRIDYVHFPYPLTDVKGDLILRVSASDPARPEREGLPVRPPADTDTAELVGFEARHETGRLWVSGHNGPVPGTRDRKLTLRIQGHECPADEHLHAALTAMKIGEAWELFQPTGAVTFGTDVEVLDRDTDADPAKAAPAPGVAPAAAAVPEDPPFDPVHDLGMVFHFRGPTVRPRFFPYRLDDLSGLVRYKGGKVDLSRFTARHADSRWGLDAAEVRFAPRGEVWANLGRLTATPVTPDAELLAALPAAIRTGMTDLKVRGGLELLVNHLVVHVPPTEGAAPSRPRPVGLTNRGHEGQAPPSPDPVVYWNGELRMHGAGFDAGVPWDAVHGVVASAGRYEGDRLGAVHGTAWLDRAAVAKQPVAGVQMSYRVRPQEPHPERPGRFTPAVLEIPDLAGRLYQGTVGGEARVVFDDQMRYRLWLTAADVKLEEAAARCGLGTGAELRGQAQARLVLENTPDPATGLAVLTGSGQIDVPSGRMLNLPVLLPLLKLLKLQAPDQTAFEEAHAAFDVRGDRVTVRQLDLIGTAVSLGGSGELDTGGENARFEFYTVWSQVMKKWLTTPNGADLTAALSGNLFKIEVTRRNGATDYKPVMLPAVTEPLKAAAERLRMRSASREPTARASEPR